MLNMLGYSLLLQGDVTSARSVLEESLALRRQEGEQWGTAWTLDGLGHVAIAEGRYAEAQTALAESLQLRYELGDRVGIAESLDSIAGLSAAQAQSERALRLAGAAAALRDAIGAPLSPMRRALLERWLIPLCVGGGARTDRA